MSSASSPERQPGESRLLKNVFSNWAGFAANLVVAFLLSPFIVHTLGNVQYGLWIVLNQFTGYLGILELGVRSSVIKYVASHRAEGESEELSRVVSSALTIYSAIAVISLAISCVLALFFPGVLGLEAQQATTARIVILISGVSVAQGFVFNVFYGVLMGIQRYDVFNRIGIIATIVKALFIVGALKNGYGITALALIHFSVGLITNLIAYYSCRRYVPELKLWLPRRDGAYRKIASYSFVTFFVTISQKVIFQTDALIVGSFLGVASVTFYAIPIMLVEYMRRIVIAMTETFVPLTSQLKAKAEHEQIRALLIRGTRVSVLIGMSMGLVLFTMGERFIALWMGPEYASNGGLVLKILAVTQMLSFGHLASREVLNGLAMHRLNAYCYGAEAIANLVLSLILVQPLGIVGVAWGTAIPHVIITTIVFPIMIARTLKVSAGQMFGGSVAPAMAAGIPFGIACFLVDTFSPAQSLPGFAIRLFCLFPTFVMGAWLVGMGTEDRAQVRAVLSRKPIAAKARSGF